MGRGYKIGVVSDIHSNYTALKAVMDELQKTGVDEVVIAGDLIGGFPQPNETIELVRKSGAKVIRGNREDYLQNYISNMREKWDGYHQMRPISWTYSVLSDQNRSFLLNLPTHIEFEAAKTSLKVVHGSPRKVSELIYKHETLKIKEALACVDEEILICGHCHQQWHDTVDGTIIVNPGSAGLSFIKDAVATYSVITKSQEGWSVEEKRVRFDAREIKEAFSKAKISGYAAWENMKLHSTTDGKVATIAFLTFARSYAVSKGLDIKEGLIPNDVWDKANELFDWENYEFKSDKL